MAMTMDREDTTNAFYPSSKNVVLEDTEKKNKKDKNQKTKRKINHEKKKQK
jgi:hypothetical protein